MKKAHKLCAKKKHQVQLSASGHLNGANMRHMREVAFGTDMTKFIRDTCFRMETLRNDGALLSAAEQKRLRKQEKIRQSLKKGTP